MVEKVKLTAEQAEALKDYLPRMGKHSLINHILELKYKTYDENSTTTPDLSLLSEIPITSLTDAIYEGYEVEPKYKDEDWVIWKTKFEETLVKINYKSHRSDGTFRFNKEEYHSDYIVRHATPEEIKAEQERQLWSSIGRRVGEFRNGDVRVLADGNSVHINDVDYARAKYIQGTLKGFYPVESYVKF